MYNDVPLNSSSSSVGKETEISRVNQRLLQVSEVLLKSIEILENRLTPILTSEKPMDSSTKAISPEYFTPLAQNINDKVRTIEIANSRINNLRDRIEL